MREMYATLSRLPILQGMNGRDLAMIQEMAGETHYAAHAHPKPFIHAHTVCNMLYFLAEGTVTRRLSAPDGLLVFEEEISAPAILEPESLYGLQCTFCCDYLPSTDVTLLVMGKTDAAFMVTRNDVFRMNLLNYLSAHIQRLREQQLRPEADEVWRRIGYMIADLSITPAGRKTLRMKMADLAQRMHETRLTVSRALGAMEKAGLMELRRREIIVPDMGRMAPCLEEAVLPGKRQ